MISDFLCHYDNIVGIPAFSMSSGSALITLVRSAMAANSQALWNSATRVSISIYTLNKLNAQCIQ